MNIRVEKVGGIWHGTIDGHPEIDERGLTEEIARRKVTEVAAALETGSQPTADPRAVVTDRHERARSHRRGRRMS